MNSFFNPGRGATRPAPLPSGKRAPTSLDSEYPDCSLAPGVHACVANGRVVFLDTIRDRYLMLKRAQTPYVLSLLHRRSGPFDDDGTWVEHPGSPEYSVLGALRREGLLSPTANRSSMPLKPVTMLPTGDLISENASRQVFPGPLNLLRFFRSTRRAARFLNHQTFVKVIDDVRARKAMSDCKLNIECARNLATSFQRLRPLYGHDFLCLFDSLALLEYFNFHRLYPSWVFGVCAEPFQAHCWVQANEVVLNDTVESVRHYTPIMTV